MIEDREPVAKEKLITPTIMRELAMMRSIVLTADISPYPIVVIVVTV